MCRHLAYLGAPIALSALLFDAPHALVKQSWAPNDMRGGGTINADGFGAAWFPAQDGPPVRYRSAMPMWSDAALPGLAGVTLSGAVLAAVRSATVGMPVVETAAAPFQEGRWLFSHNGVVRGWPDSVAKLAGRLPTTDLLTLDAPTDSALLWALIRDRLRAGDEPAEALRAVVTEVDTAAPGSRLNLLLTDGDRIAATTLGHALSVKKNATSVLVSSEPLDDDPAWQAVPDRSLLIATPTDVTLGGL
ncbi:ergothioneine biosynthesis protein EgtC [Actinoplanes sp. TFC3]|uniref:ergothioneine biosynthesis protein EgtC n=1 Tax=Actinoplanes sp. TFC3 TaxID=1710355 RepID=UPI0008375165|nr:ergothioneine biosynthesis protein EgtC [Actinoplanes sp. TFC3]